MKKLYLSAMLPVAGCLISAGATASENLIINGGFEEPALAGVSWGLFDSDETPGWTVEWMENHQPGLLELQSEGVVAPSYEGRQHAELDSHNGPNGNSNVRIYQDIPTCPGVKYTLDYTWRTRPGIPEGDALAMVHWGDGDSTVLYTVDDWMHMTMIKTATGPTTRLAFEETASASTFGTFLDAVSVTLAGGDDCTSMDIKFCSNPNAFDQSRTNGRVPVTVFGNESLDVSQVDPDTVYLCLGGPQGTCIGADKVSTKDQGSPDDVGISSCDMATPDGIDDLEVKFTAEDVCWLIGCGDLERGDSPPLYVSGKLYDGSTFGTNGEVLRINK